LEARVQARLSPAEGRRFGLVVGAAFLAIGALARWRGHQLPPVVLWSVGGLLVAGGLLVPGRMGPLYRGWMRLGRALSRVTTPIIMGVIYYGLFTPIGLARRHLGGNPLVRRSRETFWITREKTRGDLERQF
jgi:hypothetical protein